MKSRMHTLAPVLLAILVGLIAAQCAQPGGPAEQATSPGELEPTVEVAMSTPVSSVPLTYVSYWDSDILSEVDEALVERFQKAYPHVKVDREGFDQSWDSYLAAEIPPNVITWDAAIMYPWAEYRQLFMDIDPIWMQEGWEAVIPEKIKTLSQSGGRYYYLPTHYFWTAFYYNKAVFEQHDLKEPETWDEFLGVCATLKEAGVTPISIGLSSSSGGAGPVVLWIDYLNVRINGLEFRDELMLEGQVPFDDPRVRDVFVALQALLEEGYFNEDYGRLGDVLSFSSVLDGEAAMTLASVFSLERMPKSRWDELDFFRFPVIDPDLAVAETPGIEGFVIPASAPDPHAATEFLIYRGSAEAQTYWAEGCGPLGGVPVRSDVDPDALIPAQQKAREMIENADELGQFIFWLGSPMIDPMVQRVRYWFDDPGTLDETLEYLEKRRQEIFEE